MEYQFNILISTKRTNKDKYIYPALSLCGMINNIHVIDNTVICFFITLYTTLTWVFKGTAQCLTRILPRKYQDIAWAISWESGLPMTLIPKNQCALTCYTEQHRALYCGTHICIGY